MNKDIRDIREFREIKEVKDISAIREISDDAIGLGFVVGLSTYLTAGEDVAIFLEGVSEYHNRTYA